MDLDFLRPLYDGPGGYVSVYLDTARDHENAAREMPYVGRTHASGWPAPGPTSRRWMR